MFCNKCGARIDDDADFCTRCGTKVKKVNGTEEVQENKQVEIEQNNESEITVGVKTPPKSKVKKIAIGVITIILLALILLFFINKRSSVGLIDGRQDINFNNGARFAYDNSKLYFIGTYNDNDSETSVYSTSYNGTDKTLISNDENIIRIRLVNNTILYLKSNGETYTVGQINTDGSDEKEIIELSNIPDKYDGNGNTLFYLIDSELHKCNWQGGEDEIISSSVDTFTFNGEKIYYASKGSIYQYDIAKKEILELCKAKEADELAVVDGLLYFSNNEGLYNIPVNGKAPVSCVVKDEALSKYVICDDEIYYKQELATEDIAALAKYFAEDEDEILEYGLIMISVGKICRVNKNGGNGEVIEAEQLLIHDLYEYPKGLYCRVSAFSNQAEKVELK